MSQVRLAKKKGSEVEGAAWVEIERFRYIRSKIFGLLVPRGTFLCVVCERGRVCFDSEGL